MKWRHDTGPKPGDIREKFAFLPVRCDDGVTVWLQRYWVLYLKSRPSKWESMKGLKCSTRVDAETTRRFIDWDRMPDPTPAPPPKLTESVNIRWVGDNGVTLLKVNPAAGRMELNPERSDYTEPSKIYGAGPQ